MKKQTKKLTDAALLRQKAEEQLKSQQSKTSLSISEGEALKLIYELEVHQIELELQNEELLIAKDKAELAEEKYTELYDFAPSGYFTLNKDGNIIELNLAGAKMLGKERSFLINNTFGLFIKNDSRNVFSAFLKEIFQGKSNAICDVPLSCKDSNNLHLHLTGIISENRAQCHVTATDITERKNAEDDLRKNLAKYKVLIDTFPIAITLTDKAGNIIETNEKALELLGLSREEHLKRKIRGEEWKIIKTDGTVFPQDDYASVRALKENRLVENVEMGIIKPNEEITWINVTAAPIPIEDLGVLIAYNDITHRKQMEKALRENEERLRLALKATNDVVWDWDILNDTQRWNEAGKKVFGWTEIVENTVNAAWWVERIHPDDRQRVEDGFYAVVKNHSCNHWQDEYRFRKADGTYAEVLDRAYVLRDNQGNAIRMIGAMLDITESRLSKAIFKDIIEKNPISIQILNMEGYPIQVNSAHTKLFGVEPPSDYSVIKDHQLLSLGFGKLFDRIKKGEVVYFPDSFYNVHDVDPSFPDSPAWVKALGFTLNDNNGNPNKIVLMHENITEHKNAEALLNDIIENNPMSIQVVDTEGHTLRVNPAFIELFGSVPPPEFSIFDDLKRKSPILENLVSRAINGEIVHLPDIYFNAHDAVAEAPDIPLWIRALIFPLKNSAGKPERFVFMHENITESKIAEQELIKAKEHAEESDRLKTAFLANMSHEIRTPMNGILGFSQLLKQPALEGEKQQEYIEIIENSGKRMLNIINDIIDISKIESGLLELHIKESDINEQIEYIYTFFKPEAEAKRIKLSFSNPLFAKEAIIKTDREKVYAILTNLVKNAIKYTPEGSIEFGYNLKTDSEPNELEFFVKDTGIGIPKNRQEAIFERFIQADIADKMVYQGAGLGLSISKAYVEMLGGKIWVESKEGVGSIFYFTLPYNAETVKEKID